MIMYIFDKFHGLNACHDLPGGLLPEGFDNNCDGDVPEMSTFSVTFPASDAEDVLVALQYGQQISSLELLCTY